MVAPVAPVTAGVAYLNVNVPADAKVYLQDQLMTVGGTERRFVTPQMENGVQHVYTVKVEVVRNGQTIVEDGPGRRRGWTRDRRFGRVRRSDFAESWWRRLAFDCWPAKECRRFD